MSEALSMEILHKFFGAKNVYTENNIQYYMNCKKCDFITTINNFIVGVSVTRCINGSYKYNPDNLDDFIYNLLERKLIGLKISKESTLPRFKFDKTLLFVWSPDNVTTNLINYIYYWCIPQELRANYLIIVESSYDNLYQDFPSPITECNIVHVNNKNFTKCFK